MATHVLRVSRVWVCWGLYEFIVHASGLRIYDNKVAPPKSISIFHSREIDNPYKPAFSGLAQRGMLLSKNSAFLY